jgi:hypothetical protein
MSLTTAVTGSLPHMQPTYTEHLAYALPLPYPVSSNSPKVLICSF